MRRLQIHYHRYDKSYDDWSLWVWQGRIQQEVRPASVDEYGLVFRLDLSGFNLKEPIGILPKYRDWEDKDDPNRYWKPVDGDEIWLLQGDARIYTQVPDVRPFVRRAFLDGPELLLVVLTNSLKKKELRNRKIEILLENGPEVEVASQALFPTGSDSSTILQVHTLQRIELSYLPGKVVVGGFLPGDINIRGILDSSEYITDEETGIEVAGDNTVVKVYSPGASSVLFRLYEQPEGGNPEVYHLKKSERGIWKLNIPENLSGKYYTFSVSGPDPAYRPEKELINPEARCVTRYNGRGFIPTEGRKVKPGPGFTFEQAIIYELHVRDFTISEDSGVKQRGKYPGFCEEGTRIPGTDIATGLDHLLELGINTVQLMPVQSFEFDPGEGKYFWGYMPVNYNSPEGWYATRTDDDTRIRELKELIDTLHRHGIKVVLDVVYNHTAESNSGIYYNFNGFVPNFYYRMRPDGTLWNGSGCGNELRTESPMVRRFILRSLRYWVEEFGVDGFRFDLMGLIDLETMREIVTTLRKVRPDIFLYGEPWTAGATPIQPTVKGVQRGEGFAVFNDHFRDAIKGPWYNAEPGYVQNGKGVMKIKTGLMGSITDFADSPLEVINYVACHDGHTLWDRLKLTTRTEKKITEQELVAMDKLAAVLVLTAQGVPFLHGGQEFLRTKFGEHNSYNLPDSINMIRWRWKDENYDVFEYYRGLIQLRREHPMFRLTDSKQVEQNLIFLDAIGYSVPENCVAFKLKKGNTNDSWKEILVLINPNRSSRSFSVPSGKWNLVVDESIAGTRKITSFTSEKIRVKPISAMILYR